MTDITSCLCRGKADTPQTNENSLHNPTHLERSKAIIFFFFWQKPSFECLKTVGLLKTDGAIFQLEHPPPSLRRQEPQADTFLSHKLRVSTFPKALTCLEPEIQSLHSSLLPIFSPWPTEMSRQSQLDQWLQIGGKQKTVQFNHLFYLKYPFKDQCLESVMEPAKQSSSLIHPYQPVSRQAKFRLQSPDLKTTL
jgi:hypothetical protein